MERPQEVVKGIRRGERPVQQAGEAAIARQDAHVFDALAACRLDERDRLELVELRIPAPPDAYPQLLAHEILQAQAGRVSDTNVSPACAVRSIGREAGSNWKGRMPWPTGHRSSGLSPEWRILRAWPWCHLSSPIGCTGPHVWQRVVLLRAESGWVMRSARGLARAPIRRAATGRIVGPRSPATPLHAAGAIRRASGVEPGRERVRKDLDTLARYVMCYALFPWI